MALKADRHELQTDISFFMNEVATRGGIAILSTGGSGAAMDQSNALVTYSASPTTAALAISGIVPVGLLLNDMVNLDLLVSTLTGIRMRSKRAARLLFLGRVGLFPTRFIPVTLLPLEAWPMWLIVV